MEPRQMLDANPVVAGITYLEDDLGQDVAPDYFEVTFEGGADTTQMTQFVINGDQDMSGGLSQGDMFFDIDSSQPGAGLFHGFQFDAGGSQGIVASDITGVSVSSDGLQMTVNVKNFEAGDKLAFTIDVDEVETLRNDEIASGVEFEGSMFTATFVDENYTFQGMDVAIQTTLSDGQEQNQTDGLFYDEFDNLLTAGENLSNGTLDLVRDNEEGNGNRTAGGIDVYELVPKPIEISGTVYHDENINLNLDSSENGIGGVVITLEKFNDDTGQYEAVAGTQTDGQGNYLFSEDLGLTPGKYRLIESQPASYLDVGANAGQVAGVQDGSVSSDAQGNQNIIGDIDIPLGGTVAENYDFMEVLPASISGNVWHDRNDDGFMDSGEEGIANVLVRVSRIGPNVASTTDPFAISDPIFVRTDANGYYEVTALPPGIYEVTEINNYPLGFNPLVDFVDGKDAVGTIDGVRIGTTADDRFSTVALQAGDQGVEYNFGELKPASISGYVSVATPEGDCLDPTEPDHAGIAGVDVQLFDLNGNLVASTSTDNNGFYEFDGLSPGTYSIVEVQPGGYLDGEEFIGTVGGQSLGLNPINDRFVAIDLQSGDQGTMYNFCEHLPASVAGTVWHDLNNDGVLGSNEDGIGGVTIQLFDDSGAMISETVTNSNGQYQFDNLYAGQYRIVEVQPSDYLDGKESLGTVLGAREGEVGNDEFRFVGLIEGEQGVEYNFGELKPGSISGTIHADINGDCTFDPSVGDEPLSGVLLELLDGTGNVIASTTTDASGNYSFKGLDPGEYSIREFTPEGYLDGDEAVGSINGVVVGQSSNDLLTGIVLQSGESAVNYDFCEHIPASIQGTVWFDLNNDGAQQVGESGIRGVAIQLFDTEGNLVSEQFTDTNGEYRFRDLVAGEYRIVEIQPQDYVDGLERIGRVDGIVTGVHSANDEYSRVSVLGGQAGVEYDFAEIRLASIGGFVHLSENGECVFDANGGEDAVSGVTMQLLDGNGGVIAETVTDAQGRYQFDKLLPGEYSVRQIQPGDLFTSGENIGSGSGFASENLLTGIVVDSGQNLVNYDFCELESAEIRGRVWEDGPAFETTDGSLPDGYRDLRDGIYDPGVDTPIAGVRMELWYYVDPVGGAISPRQVTLGEVLGGQYDHLGNNPDSPIWVETNANGEYQFTGLPPGNYIVLESQPDGFSDANDSVGTTTGFVSNTDSFTGTQSLLLTTFSSDQIQDTVANIRVNAGEVSAFNNFSEVRAIPDNIDVPTIPRNPPSIPTPTPPGSPLIPGLGLAGAQSANFTAYIGGGRGVAVEPLQVSAPYAWHLSVVNAGQPRGGDADASQPTWLQASFLSQQDWDRFDMNAGEWTFTTHQADGSYTIDDEESIFGMTDGIPLSGDFDGDGDDEMVMYKDGYWMIDLNGNGQWDIDDLMARLGDENDRPIVGDWDGDGKDDIGIYGPAWEGDDEAIEADPGIPDPANHPLTKPKNIPPQVVEAAEGARAMRLSSFGSSRIDVIDHVFGYGEGDDVPLAGDWNGDSIRTIGVFKDGIWHIDLNGDGQFDFEDSEFSFGRAGDIPLVGDFDGDGVEEIAVFRDGTWIIDTNGNHQRDTTDQVFEMGGRGDIPVVGDWNGDGVDEPAIYKPDSSQIINNNPLH